MKINGNNSEGKTIESLYITDERINIAPVQPNNLILHLTNKTQLQIPINRDESYDKVIVRLFDKLIEVPGVMELFRREGVVLNTEAFEKQSELVSSFENLKAFLTDENNYPKEPIVWDSLEASKVKK